MAVKVGASGYKTPLLTNPAAITAAANYRAPNPYGPGAGSYGGMPSSVGGFANPFAGNIYAGVPTTIAQTPYGGMLANAKQYLYNPNQLRAIANQQAGAQISAGLGSSYANQAAEQAQLLAMQNRAAGLASALGSFGPEYGQAMQSAYTQAANTVGQFGTGVIQNAGQGLQAAQDQASQAAAAKTDGQGQVSGYNIPDITGTLTQTGVNIPGNSLAVSGLNAAQMGIYGAQADKGYALNTLDYYRQQAVTALNQRAAERASIIAQRPELFQSALEAQRQDHTQTMSNIANLVQAGQSYIASRMGLRLQTVQAQNQWLNQVVGMTHVNPSTGQPLSGYTAVRLKDGSQVVVPYKDAAQAAHFADQNAYWTSIGGARQTSATASLTRAQGAGQQFNPQLSQQLGYLVDNNRKPILDTSNNTIPYTSTSIGGTQYDPKLSAQVGYLVDKSHNPIQGANGAHIPYTAPVSTTSQNINPTASAAQGIEIGQNGLPIYKPGTTQTIPYTTKVKPPAPMDTATRVKFASGVGKFVTGLHDGITDPKTGKQTTKPQTLPQAITAMGVQGLFTDPDPQVRKTAMNALGTAYNVTPAQIIAAMTQMAKGSPTGAKPTKPLTPAQQKAAYEAARKKMMNAPIETAVASGAKSLASGAVSLSRQVANSGGITNWIKSVTSWGP